MATATHHGLIRRVRLRTERARSMRLHIDAVRKRACQSYVRQFQREATTPNVAKAIPARTAVTEYAGKNPRMRPKTPYEKPATPRTCHHRHRASGCFTLLARTEFDIVTFSCGHLR